MDEANRFGLNLHKQKTSAKRAAGGGLVYENS
jgi:hypothetical protein